MSLMLKDSRTGVRNFRLDSQYWDGTPRPGFLYYVRFVRTITSRSDGPHSQQASGNDWSKGIGVIAQEIERPQMSFDTQTLNQYNRKRIIQKKVEYEPINFTFYDTVDNKTYHMFEDYFRFYYGDPKNDAVLDWSWDITSATMNQGNSGWGFTPPTVPNTYFFSQIEFYLLYGGNYSRFDILNPKVKSFKPSNLSYEDCADTPTINIGLEYEGIVYKGNNLKISDTPGLLQEMGLGQSNFYEPRTNSATPEATALAQAFAKNAGTLSTGLADLFNSAKATVTGNSNNVNRSSSTITANQTENNIFTGIVQRATETVTDAITGAPTIGENIAKRMVKGLT